MGIMIDKALGRVMKLCEGTVGDPVGLGDSEVEREGIGCRCCNRSGKSIDLFFLLLFVSVSGLFCFLEVLGRTLQLVVYWMPALNRFMLDALNAQVLQRLMCLSI